MSETNDCGCCTGTAIDTPAAKFNRPGLPAIAYRVGTHQEFKATLLARLSSTDYPALAGLGTRDDSDYTIALLDAAATLADVLTFYQERIANEAYLRTATERRSVLELARLIGYRLAPGVAATTALAFTLQEAPGQPSLAPQPVTIPAGTRVQSVPDPGQDAQTFETVAEIVAQVEWNAIPAQQTQPIRDWARRSELNLAGTATQLQPGDAILFVGAENATDRRWAIRSVESVQVDAARGTTRMRWLLPLDDGWSKHPEFGVSVHALRQRATPFGSNAPDPRLIFRDANADKQGLTVGGAGVEWVNFSISSAVFDLDLDAAYPKILPGSWIVLTGTGDPALFQVSFVTQIARADFGLSAKVTSLQVTPAGDLANFTDLRTTAVLSQSEELAIADDLLSYPVYGGTLALDRREPGLVPGQLLGLSGKRQRVAVGLDTENILFSDDKARKAVPGESFLMTAPPEQLFPLQVLSADRLAPGAFPSLEGKLLWHVEDEAGRKIIITAFAGRLKLQPAAKDDPVVSEICAVADAADAVVSDAERTTVTLQAAPAYCYDRATVTVNANVAPATHGETVGEIAGNGDASRANQSFRLKQKPLTYVSTASDPSGRAATLQVRVNDLLWSETPTLYGRGSRERVYALRQDDDGNTNVQFGDGVEGRAPAQRTEQYPRQLPQGHRQRRQSAQRAIDDAADAAARRAGRQQSRPVVGRPGSGNPDRRPQERAAARAHSRSRRVGRRLRRFRPHVRRHRQGLRAMDR